MKPWEACMLRFQAGLGGAESPRRPVDRYTDVLPTAETFVRTAVSSRPGWWAVSGLEVVSPQLWAVSPSEAGGEAGMPGRAVGRAAQGGWSWGSGGPWQRRIGSLMHMVGLKLPRELTEGVGLTHLAASHLWGTRAGHSGAVLLQEFAGRGLSLRLLLAWTWRRGEYVLCWVSTFTLLRLCQRACVIRVVGTVMAGVSQARVSARGTCQRSVKRGNLEAVPRKANQRQTGFGNSWGGDVWSLEWVTTPVQGPPLCGAWAPLGACSETWGDAPEPSTLTAASSSGALVHAAGHSEMKMAFFFFPYFKKCFCWCSLT